MSTHCSKYPSCGCAPEMGTQCHFEEEASIEEVKQRIEQGVSNQVPTKEIYRVRTKKIWKGAIAPRGKQFVVIDFRHKKMTYKSAILVEGSLPPDELKIVAEHLMDGLKKNYNIS